ncbi:MAG: FAD/FMN-containing dehydrogenase, partial [Candidatus Paceibacteria bacterium]
MAFFAKSDSLPSKNEDRIVSPKSLVDALKEVAHSDHSILSAAEHKSPYETGARREQGQAALVLRPASNEEMSAMVAICVQSDIEVVPQSANTGVVWGSTPDATGNQVLLSLDRMSQLFELDLVNRSVRVGAGVRLSELNAKLEQYGLFFPIDLGADPMIGGMISTNTGGSRFMRYGDVRANTLGLKVVLGDRDGTLLDLTSGLRKNNVGVDWKHVFIGTTGAFGIVTEAVLNLELVPKQT